MRWLIPWVSCFWSYLPALRLPWQSGRYLPVSVGYHHLGELIDPSVFGAGELALDDTGHVLITEAVDGGVSFAALCFIHNRLGHRTSGRGPHSALGFLR